MSNRYLKGSLLATTVIAGMAIATPALSQTTTPVPPQDDSSPNASQPDEAQPQTPAPGEPSAGTATDTQGDETIVVTGSILRRVSTETPSPVTVLTSESLDQRGINTVSEALQRVSANNAGTITQGWNTGSNFATGANAVSLRGLTVQSTLTLFNGMRMAPYPLGDDGRRNFVDSNTIMDGVIDRIEILRDGASSTYGADAVAGVVNVITKKQITGVHLNMSAGVSTRGDAPERRIDAQVGYGDLDSQGFNAYIAAEYQTNDKVWARDRGYPFNSSDLSGVCNPDGPECMQDARQFGINWNGTLTAGTTLAPLISPYALPTASGAGRLAPYQLLNPGGCDAVGLPSVVLTPAQQGGTAALPTYQPNQCQQDLREQYSQLQPDQERKGLTGRVTFNIGEDHQAFAEANYYKVTTHTQLSPLAFANQTTPPGAVLLSPVYLPIYVCANGVGDLLANTGCNALNGSLNPNNPFAANNQYGRLILRYDRPRDIRSDARSLRGALGVSGEFADTWRYSADFTASNVQLDIEQNNFMIPQRILDVIATGEYNFVNQSLNSQTVRDYIAPQNKTRSDSDLWQVSGTVSRDLFELPGGMLQAAVGLQYRHESVDNPSANPQNDAHPFDRYYGVNSVGTSGSRNVKSAFFEVGAPVLDNLEVNVSGRYDDYSSGQTNFSPKVGAKFTPIRQLALRGTWSKGFRIPSFSEAYGLPTTGYITTGVNCTTFAAFCASHGNNSYVSGNYSYGLTATGNPELKSEKSNSITAGAVFEPVRNVSFTVDFWRIKVKDLITGVDYSEVPDLYYANNGVVNIPGINVVPGLPDPQNPGALPLLGFIEYSYGNADSQLVKGLDFGANVKRDIGPFTWLSSFEASYLIKFEKRFDSGTVQRYDGTLSPCDVTSCSGAPKWRGSWQNTLDFGRASLTGTAYYTSGYDLASTDYGGVKNDCEGASLHASVVDYYQSGGIPVRCNAKKTWNFDIAGDYRVTDRLKVYANVLNVFDIDAPFEPSAAYSIYQFNPAWAGPNIMGRFFRMGAKVDF